MYVVVEFLDADPAQRASLRQALVMFAHQCLAGHGGCLTFDVAQDELDGSAFLLYRRFEDKAAYLASLEHADTHAHRAEVDRWIKTRRTLTYESLSEAGVA